MKKAFEEALNVISSILKPAVAAMEDFYTSVFQPIFDHIKSATGVFNEIGKVVGKVKNTIAPVKWALHAASCVFDQVIKPVIDGIMNVSCLILHDIYIHQFILQGLGLKNLVNNFTSKLTGPLHLAEFLTKIEQAFDLDKLMSASTAMSDSATGAADVEQVYYMLVMHYGAYHEPQ